jgi:glutamine---fructose-6-phosphate transaminase (isomerizing)
VTEAPEYLDGVRAQPDVLRRSAETVRAALAGSAVVDALHEGRVAVVGMGASAAAASGFAAALRAAGRPASAVSPAAVVPGLAQAYVAISQSGRSRETVEALANTGEARRIGVTEDAASPLAAAVDAVLPLGCGPDTKVSTLSYTATIQALALLLDALADRTPTWPGALADAAAAVLGAGAAPLVDAFGDVSIVDVIGSGPRTASAGAAALLLREAAHLPTAAYETREYLHGHLEIAGPGRGALLFATTDRELTLAGDLATYGSSVVLVTALGETPLHRNLRVVRLPALPGMAACALDILPVQLAAHDLAGQPIALHHMPPDTKLAR